MTGRHDWKHYLSSTSLGNYFVNVKNWMVHHSLRKKSTTGYNPKHPRVIRAKYTELARGLNSFSPHFPVPLVTKYGFTAAGGARMKGEQEKVVRRPVYCRSFGLITVNFIQRKSEGKSDRTKKEKNAVEEKVSSSTTDFEVRSTETTVSKIQCKTKD